MNYTVLDWLYENEQRSYPVRDGSLRTDGSFILANDVILDAQFVFTTYPTNFRLTQIVRDANITFHFSNGLVITSTLPNTINRIRHSAGHLLVLGKGAQDIPVGTYDLNVYFEPSVIHEYGGAWEGVSSLTFGEGDTNLGIFEFLEGYQFDISIANQNIAFAIGNLYGTPIACEHFSSYPEDCNSIISYISSTAPDGSNLMYLQGGSNIVVWDDPDNHRIFVGFAFTSPKDICPDIPPFPIN